MFKKILFNILFFTCLSAVSYASDNAISENYGKEKPKAFFLEDRYSKNLNSFSLRSKMQFKGEKLVSDKANTNYISLNTSVSYQNGQNRYVMPNRKNVILNRITFNPNQKLQSY
jgi:hypothetical protein